MQIVGFKRFEAEFYREDKQRISLLYRSVKVLMSLETLAAILLNRRICRFKSYGAHLERLAKLVYAHD